MSRINSETLSKVCEDFAVIQYASICLINNIYVSICSLKHQRVHSPWTSRYDCSGILRIFSYKYIVDIFWRAFHQRPENLLKICETALGSLITTFKRRMLQRKKQNIVNNNKLLKLKRSRLHFKKKYTLEKCTLQSVQSKSELCRKTWHPVVWRRYVTVHRHRHSGNLKVWLTDKRSKKLINQPVFRNVSEHFWHLRQFGKISGSLEKCSGISTASLLISTLCQFLASTGLNWPNTNECDFFCLHLYTDSFQLWGKS